MKEKMPVSYYQIIYLIFVIISILIFDNELTNIRHTIFFGFIFLYLLLDQILSNKDKIK